MSTDRAVDVRHPDDPVWLRMAPGMRLSGRGACAASKASLMGMQQARQFMLPDESSLVQLFGWLAARRTPLNENHCQLKSYNNELESGLDADRNCEHAEEFH